MLASQAPSNYGRPAPIPEFKESSPPEPPHGQGKRATTIIADQGDFVTVITDVPYNVRSRHVPGPSTRGSRAMHRTTLTLPTQNFTDYSTTSKNTFDGSRKLMPSEMPVKCPPQHRSQFSFQHKGEEPSPWSSNYSQTYINKGSDTPQKLHEPTLDNKFRMTEGSSVKQAMTAPHSSPAGWTQYKRTHDKLGVLRGPGVPRERSVRQQFNVLTGENLGAAWKADNKRTSGNRVLYHSFSRKDAERQFVLG